MPVTVPYSIVVYLIAEMVKFFRYKSYLFQIWNWLELVLLVVSVVTVMLSLFKAKETSLDVRRIQSISLQRFQF